MDEIKQGCYDFKFINALGVLVLTCVPIINIALFVICLICLLGESFIKLEGSITNWIRGKNPEEIA